MSKQDDEKKTLKKHGVVRAIRNVLGGAVLCAAATVVIPILSPYVTGLINKKANKISNAKKSDDDWGPVIEKIHHDKEED